VIFCLQCGTEKVSRRTPPGDTHERHVCDECAYVHYENPKVIAGCIPEYEGKILLCRRAIEPRRGWWTLPAGFLELGETMAEGASREALEEANAVVAIESLYTIFSVPHISQVYAFFRARLPNADFAPGEESLAVALYDEHDIPWDDIAFAAVHKTLELYFADRREGRFRTHSGDVVRTPGPDAQTHFQIHSQ
jgi:ADP-ribose pyrophosphatase YjhB (NUDIX family)